METVQYFGDDEEDFVSNRTYQHAVSFALEHIGEHAKRVSMESVNAFPNIQWVDLIRLRDLYAHAYHKVMPSLQWKYIALIPKLREDCQDAIDVLRSKQSQ